MTADRDWLAERFEEQRSHLRAVAYRMLGSLSEAEDAVQEAWFRLSRADTSDIANVRAWLTTVVARISLDMLRARKSRREDSLDAAIAEGPAIAARGANPEQEAILADSVGLALLVVMEKLEPAERLVFVLHDMFAVPFTEIAPIVDRTPTAARHLASRARRRVHGAGRQQREGEQTEVRGRASSTKGRTGDLKQQRAVVDAFLTAARGGDLQGLLAVLDPDVVYRAPAAVGFQEAQGAEAVAPLAMRGRAVAARALLVNGKVGVVVAPRGHLLMVLDFTIHEGKVVAIEAIADPARVEELDLAVLEDTRFEPSALP
jgi:RNA polymerase sigma factor (sigma-70 family)